MFFNTFLYDLKSHAEVDPQFVYKFQNKIRDPWIIMKEDGGVQPLTFNPSLINPTLSEGWDKLKEYHGFPDNVEVVFGYYGNNMFGVVMFREMGCCTEFPSYHSRSLLPAKTRIFDVQLTPNDFISELLVGCLLCYSICFFFPLIFN